MPGPKLLLTGIGGFIGSHVARCALDAGWDVAGIVHPQESRGRIEDLAPRLAFTEGDITDAGAVSRIVNEIRPDACVHLAWCVRPGNWRADPENVTFVPASLHLLSAAADAGCRAFVGAGTCGEYDPDSGFLREDGPEKPGTLYAACKLAVRHVGARLAAERGVRFAWGRVFYVYGPREDPRRVVPAAILAAMRGEDFPASHGRQVRDYLHVEDVAAALFALASRPADGVYNVCSGDPVTIRRLLATAGRLAGGEERIRFGQVPTASWDPPFLCGDNRRLSALGWEPRHTMEEGLEQTVRWWRRQDAGAAPSGEESA